MNRRNFISLATTIIAMTPASLLAARQNKANNTIDELEEPWQTLSSVMEHLFPASDNSPGASDIQAVNFLQTILNTPGADPEEKDFIFKGTGWLNDMASKTFKLPFIRLNNRDKESVLRKIEQSNAGERWLSLLLTYLIEALLSDPVYGGNPDGIGWKWLEHQPGFPRPTIDKVFYKLGNTRYTRTKA
ncbi:MAG: gluconate 2-dehydrogenase subunit 3 family protein [Gammaproteobacteria bacterium]|nr:gluconate 2-dehydrogenase subunit 3 family protein [Gammaproteobacteria bacterium]